jgi:hypothetical protein
MRHTLFDKLHWILARRCWAGFGAGPDRRQPRNCGSLASGWTCSLLESNLRGAGSTTPRRSARGGRDALPSTDGAAGSTVDNFETAIAADTVKNSDIYWEFPVERMVRNQVVEFG